MITAGYGRGVTLGVNSLPAQKHETDTSAAPMCHRKCVTIESKKKFLSIETEVKHSRLSVVPCK